MEKKTEALEVHAELNPKLWNGMELKEDVKNKLLEIANTFIKGLDYPLNVADIRFLGSNASFNYNDNSDIDLHIISNFDLSYVDKDILQILYNSSKNSFNNNHDITIHDIPVELYVEDMNSINATNGSYSILKDKWVMTPEPITYEIPDYSTELNSLLGEIEEALKNGSKEEIEELINKIYLGRKDGLATEGEASIGNCVFKEIRNMGLMDELRQRFYELESQELTLESKLVESAEDFDGVVNEEEPSAEIKEKEEEYKDYITTHIENVKKAYDRIVKPLIEDEFTGKQIKELEHNLEVHDQDKSIPFMFDAYRRDHYPINDKEKEDAEEDYDIAWSYHKHSNPHHWEYWLNNNGDFALDPDLDAMKVAYAEMFCDWLSFGFRKEDTSATGESTEFETWYNEAKENIKIHPELQEWYDDKITKIIDFIDENKDTLYESYNKSKLTESSVIKYDYEYRVEVPLKSEIEDGQEYHEDSKGNDIEMDIDIDSLYDSYAEIEGQIEDIFNNEDILKEIFPTVGLGRVYPTLISLDEDYLIFKIGFSSIQDPVEKGNEIRLEENELKEQIEELAEYIIDNTDNPSAMQYYDTDGYEDEDGDTLYDQEYSDERVYYSLDIDKSKKIKIEKEEV